MSYVMFFILGIAVGGLVPLAYCIRVLCKGIMLQIRGHEEEMQKLIDAEYEIKKLKKEIDEIEEKFVLNRAEVPYDAMGDYSGLKTRSVRTGMESADEWYRQEFGGEA